MVLKHPPISKGPKNVIHDNVSSPLSIYFIYQFGDPVCSSFPPWRTVEGPLCPRPCLSSSHLLSAKMDGHAKDLRTRVVARNTKTKGTPYTSDNVGGDTEHWWTSRHVLMVGNENEKLANCWKSLHSVIGTHRHNCIETCHLHWCDDIVLTVRVTQILTRKADMGQLYCESQC